jgi:hypothetical protein
LTFDVLVVQYPEAIKLPLIFLVRRNIPLFTHCMLLISDIDR